MTRQPNVHCELATCWVASFGINQIQSTLTSLHRFPPFIFEILEGRVTRGIVIISLAQRRLRQDTQSTLAFESWPLFHADPVYLFIAKRAKFDTSSIHADNQDKLAALEPGQITAASDGTRPSFTNLHAFNTIVHIAVIVCGDRHSRLSPIILDKIRRLS
jgi:hypothetical protein